MVIKYTHKRRLLKIGKIFNKIKIYRILEHAKIHIKEELKMSKIYLLNEQKFDGVENLEVFEIEYLKFDLDLKI